MDQKSTIAFLGTGAMGIRMATRLIEAGHRIIAFNRTQNKMQPLVEQGAIPASSPREAASQADLVISMIRDVEASNEIWLDPERGAIQGLTKGSITIEASTLTPEWVRHLSKEILIRNAHFLDAPVVGTRPHAEAGQLTFLVGGDVDIFASIQHILQIMGVCQFHIGPTGSGMQMKLAINSYFGVQAAALGEMIALLDLAGMPPEKTMAVIETLPVFAPAMQHIAKLMQSNSFSPNFPIELVAKDLRYLIETAALQDRHLPITTAAHDVFREATSAGLGDLDISGIIKANY